METRLDAAPALAGTLAVNPRDTVRMTVRNAVEQRRQDLTNANFNVCRWVADDEEFGQFFLAVLFDRFITRNPRGGH